MLTRVLRLACCVLTLCPIVFSADEIIAQDENMEIDPAWIVYSCSNGFNVNNICLIDENGNFKQKITNTIYSNRESEDPSINIHGRIAHTCELENSSRDICVIDINGNNRVQRSTVSPHVFNYNPVMNDQELIIHLCTSDFRTVELCVIEAGSSVSKILDLPSPLSSSGSYSLDNDGRVLYTCRTSAFNNNLCVINSDGSGFRAIWDSGSSSGSSFTNASVNAQGIAVFNCVLPETGEGICQSDLNTEDPPTLIVKSTDELDARRPRINDAGQVAYTCGPLTSREDEVCVLDVNGGTPPQMLTEIGDGIDHFVRSITKNGVVVHTCSDGPTILSEFLCSTIFDGSATIELFKLYNRERSEYPLINNNGQILFECTNSFAVTHTCFANDSASEINNLSEAIMGERSDLTPADIDFNEMGDVVTNCRLDDDTFAICLLRIEEQTYEVVSDQEKFISEEFIDPSINNNGIIGFRCEVERQRKLCLTDKDGSRHEILEFDGVDPQFFAPEINDVNQIVAICEVKGIVNDVCVIDLDEGSTLTVLTDSLVSGDNIFSNPSINNLGRVIHECNNFYDDTLLSQICSINSDRTGFLNHSEGSTNSNLDVRDQISLNDEGVAVFPCINLDTNGQDICVSKPDFNDGSLIEHRIIMEWTLKHPSINNQNEIVFVCIDYNGNRNICYHDMQTGESEQLTFLDGNGETSGVTSQ